MKQKLHIKILSLFLTFGLIFSSVGVAVSVHTCKYTGNQKVALFSMGGCCMSITGDDMASCCLIDVEYSQLDTEKVLAEGVNLPQGINDLFVGFLPVPLLSIPELEMEKGKECLRPPPLLSGHQRLHLFQQYRQ